MLVLIVHFKAGGSMRLFILFSLLFLSQLFGQGRIIMPHPPRLPLKIEPVILEKSEAQIRINDGVARVRLNQWFRNPAAYPQQGAYLYALDASARMDAFFLYINGQKTRGELLDKEDAEKIYMDIVRRMKDPALLEYTGRGAFKTRIFPIGAGEKRQLELQFTQTALWENGNYKFSLPLRQSGQAAIASLKIAVDLQTARPLASVYSPSHKIRVKRLQANHYKIEFDAREADATQDFILYYTLRAGKLPVSLFHFRPRTDRYGYFTLFVAPPLNNQNMRIIPKDVIFVVDASGSMGGTKMEQARSALRYCLQILNPRDRFEIIRFSSTITPFADRLMPANEEARANARYFIDNLRAGGGTNINAAIQRAIAVKQQADKRPTSIVFLTDGLPTEGERNIRKIIGNIPAEKTASIRFFNFGIGYDVNTFLLDKLAVKTGGSSRYVRPTEDIEKPVSTLFARISSPVLTDVRLEFKGIPADDIYPRRLPDLFRGQRLMVCGRYPRAGRGVVEVHGLQNGREKVYRIPVEFPRRNTTHDFVARLWANRKVDYYLDKIRFEGEKDEWVATVKQLAREYGIVTPYSSYLVREQKEELVRARRNANPLMRSQMGKVKAESVDMLMALSAAPSTAVAASGYAAVAGSSARNKLLKKNEQSRQMLVIHKNIAGHSFFFKNGVWVQENISLERDRVVLHLVDREYMRLLHSSALAKRILALGPRLLFRLNGKVYSVE